VAAKKDPPREKPQRIADELRSLILSGHFADGDLLGHESELVERFGVSRPSLREALRILETQGLISVVRGVSGGVFARWPDERITARTAALVLQARTVSLADVYRASSQIEPLAARRVAGSPRRAAAAAELGALIDEQEKVIGDPEAFGRAIAVFHDRLMALGGNQTLAVVSDMLDEIVIRGVEAVNRAEDIAGPMTIRRRGLRSRRRLVTLIEAGDGPAAEAHWRNHMTVVGKVVLGDGGDTVVDLLHHY
jgi:DNA-binding FadR family transcriptional regulator